MIRNLTQHILNWYEYSALIALTAMFDWKCSTKCVPGAGLKKKWCKNINISRFPEIPDREIWFPGQFPDLKISSGLQTLAYFASWKFLEHVVLNVTRAVILMSCYCTVYYLIYCFVLWLKLYLWLLMNKLTMKIRPLRIWRDGNLPWH